MSQQTYRLLIDGGLKIQCLLCLKISDNPNDVRTRYCGHCHRFHEDPAPHPPSNALQRVGEGLDE